LYYKKNKLIKPKASIEGKKPTCLSPRNMKACHSISTAHPAKHREDKAPKYHEEGQKALLILIIDTRARIESRDTIMSKIH
jgi:hypothetical protein